MTSVDTRVFFQTQKTRKPQKTRAPKYGGKDDKKGEEAETLRLMTPEEHIFHFQTYCINLLVHNITFLEN